MQTSPLAPVVDRSRAAYMQRIAEPGNSSWWTAVVVTASSARQADHYAVEIQNRQAEGTLPSGVAYLVAPDPGDRRIGTGGATLNALHVLAEHLLPGTPTQPLESWWRCQRVLVIHAGGDSRRLPQYSLAGKLFSALPVRTPWGRVSTVWDETIALSTAWAESMAAGLVVMAGNVVLVLDPLTMDWSRPGITGVALRQPAEMADHHGVYVVDQGRVYAFLQNQPIENVRAAGGMLDTESVALDTGLLRCDADVAARLMELAGVHYNRGAWEFGPGVLAPSPSGPPYIDLHRHITMALTGQWKLAGASVYRQIANSLAGVPLSCVLAEGSFHHVGSTKFFRRVLAQESGFTSLYACQDRLGAGPGGSLVDSVLAETSEIAPGAIVLECHLNVPIFVARRSIIHGLSGLSEPISIPEDTVVHQIPVALPDGRRGHVIRVYGIEDNPRSLLPESTWFGRPILEALAELGLDPAQAWHGVPSDERSLWNARLFGFGSLSEAWRYARWILNSHDAPPPSDWVPTERLSLASSTEYADTQTITEARLQRLQALWQLTAASLAESGTDVRPLLLHAPGVASLIGVGRTLFARGESLEELQPTEAASQYFQASLFLSHGGLTHQAERSRAAAFACVRKAVDAGAYDDPFREAEGEWRLDAVTVSAPARIDMGGGWSDTPPFCLDWGGTVLNIAILPKMRSPISTSVARLDKPLIRYISEDTGSVMEYHATEEICAAVELGSPAAIPLAALRIAGIVQPCGDLHSQLAARGGGIEVRTRVNLPLGSGLGTSSILAATLVRALGEMMGVPLTDSSLSDQVMRLEQHITSGGGWQDQAGGIFSGAKMITSGPGLRQRLRVKPLAWTDARQRDFSDRFLLYYTGIRRIAKGLLTQVVGKYLAREARPLQVLHSIKTLASEMDYAMCEGDWEYLGSLLDRHWALNQVLDSHTINAPIATMLRLLRPYLAGAKLAGAGGGGFLMLLAKSSADAGTLRTLLASPSTDFPGELYDFRIAPHGLIVDYPT